MSKLTPAFWKWFGDSKVVDEEGQPLVVYHGTSKRFRKFNLKKATQGIIWFSSDRAKIERGESGAEGRSVVMELFASIQNPAGWKEYEKLMLGQIRQDFDGVILREKDGSFDGFVFDPKRIKSANGNDGSFDADDANIRSNPNFYETETHEDWGRDEYFARLEDAMHRSVKEITTDAADFPIVRLTRKDGMQLIVHQTSQSGKNNWQVSWLDKNDTPSMHTLFKTRGEALRSIAGAGGGESIGVPGEWHVVETRNIRNRK